MSADMRMRVERFISKAENLSWPEGIIDFNSSSFCVSGVKPLSEVNDEILSAFVWCWSMKDNLKKSLYDSKLHISQKVFSKHFEQEINNYFELTVCADIANIAKHSGLSKEPRSGLHVRLDTSHLINISKDSVDHVQRLGGNYYITPKNDDSVKLQAFIVNEDGERILDAFLCLEKSLVAWDRISDKYLNSVLSE